MTILSPLAAAVEHRMDFPWLAKPKHTMYYISLGGLLNEVMPLTLNDPIISCTYPHTSTEVQCAGRSGKTLSKFSHSAFQVVFSSLILTDELGELPTRVNKSGPLKHDLFVCGSTSLLELLGHGHG
jgi:hypothetical protein